MNLPTSNFQLRTSKSGFTVLEFIIVTIIIGILLAIILAGLSLSRERARDDVRISTINRVMIGLEQYRDACREYPIQLLASASNGCPIGTNLGVFIPGVDDLGFASGPSISGAEYKYVSLSHATLTNTKCTGYHIGVLLENKDRPVLEEDGDDMGNDFNSDQLPVGMSLCRILGGSMSNVRGFDGTDPVYDFLR